MNVCLMEVLSTVEKKARVGEKDFSSEVMAEYSEFSIHAVIAGFRARLLLINTDASGETKKKDFCSNNKDFYS